MRSIGGRSGIRRRSFILAQFPGAPGQCRWHAVDVGDDQRDPVAVVVTVQQRGHGQTGRERAQDLDLAAVHAGRVRIALRANGFDEHPATVGKVQGAKAEVAEAFSLTFADSCDPFSPLVAGKSDRIDGGVSS